MEDDKTVEARFLEQNPHIRPAVAQSEEFRAWQRSLPTVDIDQEKFYVRGGDQLKDEDQIILEWARRHRADLLPAGGDDEAAPGAS